MANLQHRGLPATTSAVPQSAAELQPRRSTAVMRKYDVTALMADETISEKSVVAPATQIFEEAATAFARGTLVSTPQGPMAVEDLLPGDLVETDRGPEPVVWKGTTTFVPNVRTPDSTLTCLYRITAEAFGFNRPMSDIMVGPGARMTVRREHLRSLIGRASVLTPISDYCDGDRIFEIMPPSSVQLYHVSLERHGTILAGGFEMESYHPGRNAGAQLGQNMRALFLSMFPNITLLEDFGELTMTRTSREVIDGLMVGT